MEGLPRQGEVIFVSFPYSDLTATKVRPAIVLAQVKRDDVLICQVTSRSYADPNAVELGADAFATGRLPKASYAQAGKLFTCHAALVRDRVGVLRQGVTQKVVEALIALLRRG